jgi:hypothetical protein
LTHKLSLWVRSCTLYTSSLVWLSLWFIVCFKFANWLLILYASFIDRWS